MARLVEYTGPSNVVGLEPGDVGLVQAEPDNPEHLAGVRFLFGTCAGCTFWVNQHQLKTIEENDSD